MVHFILYTEYMYCTVQVHLMYHSSQRLQINELKTKLMTINNINLSGLLVKIFGL